VSLKKGGGVKGVRFQIKYLGKNACRRAKKEDRKRLRFLLRKNARRRREGIKPQSIVQWEA